MNLKFKLPSSALGILVIFASLHHGQGYHESGSGLSSSSVFGKLIFTTTLLTFSDFYKVQAVPSLFNRRGPGPVDSGSSEDESDEDDNESQARVEPQITPLNRDECLAKLLCGMSVPVTGTGAPKNGYYSEYANIVAKFFEAFPLEEDEKSAESLEAYDDYSVEDDGKKSNKPARINSKKKKVENDNNSRPSSPGLQLIDLAVISSSSDPKNSTLMKGSTSYDDERNDRSIIKKRESRARKMVAKLGEKLQTVRQCQQISGCPFTFKQLRSKLKTQSSISSNVPLDTQSSTKYIYKPLSKPKPKPLSTELTLGPVVKEPHIDAHKGDDELEEFFAPPPIRITRPPGFGGNHGVGQGQQQNKPTTQQQYYQSQKFQDSNQDYIPYEPINKNDPTAAPAFPKRKDGYKIPSFVNKKPSSDSDEFDDVNQSTGPVKLVDSDFEKWQQEQQNRRPKPQSPLQQFQLHKQQEQQQLMQLFLQQQQLGQQSDKNNKNNDHDNENENDDYNYDDDDEYDDDEYDDDESNEDEEEDEDEEDDKESENNKKKSKESQKLNETQSQEIDTAGTKKKIKKYKNPNPESLVIIEEDFETKKNNDDDELEHPDNVWSKLSFATSAALIKPPKNPTKTQLQEKNDEKLNLSKEKNFEEKNQKKTESEEESSAKKTGSDEESEEEEDDDDQSRRSYKKPSKVSDDDEKEEEDKSRERPSKFSYDDEEEFEKVSTLLTKSKKTKRKSNTNSRGRIHPKKSSSKLSTHNKESKNKKPIVNSEEEHSEEEVKKVPKKAPLLEIGGRPLFPPPEKETKQSQKTSTLSRFKFSLIRPYATPPSTDERQQNYPKIRSSLSSDTKYLNNKNSKNSFKKDITAEKNSESYLPAVSFGASNGGKVGNVEFLGIPSTPAKKNPTLIQFPFARPFTSLASFFKRPGSKKNQDIPGNQHVAPVSAFVHRPVGPESNSFKRNKDRASSSSNKARSDIKSKGKSSKGNKKKSSSSRSSSKRNSSRN